MLAAIGLTLLALGGSALEQEAQPPPVPRNYEADLKARHPEIVERADFSSWIEVGKVGPWYESAAATPNHRKVTVQDIDGNKVFAVLLATDGEPKVQRIARVDLTRIGLTRKSAIDAGDQLSAAGTLRRTRPVVDFGAGDDWTFSWEFQLEKDARVETYRLKDKTGALIKLPAAPGRGRANVAGRGVVPSPARVGARPQAGMAVIAPPMAAAPSGAPSSSPPPTDDLAANELHHPGAFIKEALDWTIGAPTKQDRAQRIFEHVRDEYFYDADITGIAEFTWADQLTRGINERSGVCDEIAVVAVSYLRSLGIKARLRILTWSVAGAVRPVQHEALEYEDDAGKWQHLDAAWKTFNDRTVYRLKQSARNVLVMEATFPDDARSTVPAWTFKDPSGDGRLHPYFDFVIAPAYPGSRLPGYSY